MKRKKLKLKTMDMTPLSERVLSKVFGGFVATSSSAPGSGTLNPTCTASVCNGVDVDVTNASDRESD
jgi:hypothetical protein